VQARCGAIDLLVNNAAIAGPIGPCWESSPDDWCRALDVNLRGALLCTHAVISTMIARRRGRIINALSGALPIAYFSAVHDEQVGADPLHGVPDDRSEAVRRLRLCPRPGHPSARHYPNMR
jgi:NAD(P)-dependent dehydrogenase (short-subunit alcohol dehydrogenase family)